MWNASATRASEPTLYPVYQTRRYHVSISQVRRLVEHVEILRLRTGYKFDEKENDIKEKQEYDFG